MTEGAQRRGLRRLLGLDRSAPPPPSTLPGSPLRPWTIPNLVGYARVVGLVLFVVFAARSGDGHSTAAAVLYGAVAWGDYLDGILARITGQYSRLGALLDPAIDRLMIIAGAGVAWNFELLPRTWLALLLAREIAMLALARMALHRRGAITINWVGRLAVWPLMSSLFFALAGALGLAHGLLVIGVVMAYLASALYARVIFARPPVTAAR
ncbi:MAG: CDP-alcohol phosphatidyltransferase family protein [Solirubrobacteraceae bacterium]|nr:CDP-alcohol phosphatidyltransferase family protein [Solirubrobacteraceae bacterium]